MRAGDSQTTFRRLFWNKKRTILFLGEAVRCLQQKLKATDAALCAGDLGVTPTFTGPLQNEESIATIAGEQSNSPQRLACFSDPAKWLNA
jgi:hypothetical protein